MATFAKSTFSHASYAAFRPSYPPSLYNAVLAYHQGAKTQALDLGCGHGLISRSLAPHFTHTLGTDPSPGMIKQAQELSPKSDFPGVSFREGSAETGSRALPDSSVDLVVAGQAAHWFDQSKLWPEMARVVRAGGSLAFWGYKDHVFVDSPAASAIMQDYAYSSDPAKMGSYWPQPGRSYVQDKLRVVRPPEGEWGDLRRVEYEPGTRGKGSGEGTVFMEAESTVGAIKAYVRTWSAFHGWKEAHPERVARRDGGEGDVVDECFEAIAREDAVFGDEERVVRVEWGSALIMARRK